MGRTREKGSVAIEFAMVSVPLFFFFWVSVDVSLGILRQYSLDHISNEMARCLSIKGIQQTRVEFLSEQICETPRPFLKCDSLEIGAMPVGGSPADVSHDNLIAAWDLGGVDELVVVEVAHPSMSLLPMVQLNALIDQGGEDYLYSRSVIRTEPFAGSRTGGEC